MRAPSPFAYLTFGPRRATPPAFLRLETARRLRGATTGATHAGGGRQMSPTKFHAQSSENVNIAFRAIRTTTKMARYRQLRWRRLRQWRCIAYRRCIATKKKLPILPYYYKHFYHLLLAHYYHLKNFISI